MRDPDPPFLVTGDLPLLPIGMSRRSEYVLIDGSNMYSSRPGRIGTRTGEIHEGRMRGRIWILGDYGLRDVVDIVHGPRGRSRRQMTRW